MSCSPGIQPPKIPVTAGSSGKAESTTPNVCKMPASAPPLVPSPLPNIGKSGNSDVHLGEGLTAMAKEVTGALEHAGESVTNFTCDMNLERYCEEKWALVCLRRLLHIAIPTVYVSAADCLGAVRAASAPLFAMPACHAWARPYAKGHTALIWASSEGGLRGAALVECDRVV